MLNDGYAEHIVKAKFRALAVLDSLLRLQALLYLVFLFPEERQSMNI